MNPADPKNWPFIIDASAYTQAGMVKSFGLCASTVAAWFRDEKPSTPRTKSIERMTPVMMTMQATPRLEKHPSYGYATPEQIDVLFGGGMCPDRDKILAQIKLQGKHEGKIFT